MSDDLLIIIFVFIFIIGIALLKTPTSNYQGELNNELNNIPRIDPKSKYPDYMNAGYVKSFGHSEIYHTPGSPMEYKIYPLCCEECKRNAMDGLNKLRIAIQNGAPISPIGDVFLTKNHPTNSLKQPDYEFMVIVKEHLEQNLQPGTYKFEDFEKLAHYLKNAKNIDSSLNNIKNLKIDNIDDAICSPKVRVLKKIDPIMFDEPSKYINYLNDET
jgi:hypothetical protein